MAKAKKKSSNSPAMGCCVDSPADKKRRQEWETEDDMRTLTRAAEIKADKARVERVKKMAADRMAELKKMTA